MTKLNIILLCVIVFGLLLFFGVLNISSKITSKDTTHKHTQSLLQTPRQTVKVMVDENKKSQQSVSVEANKLPEFMFHLADKKFDSILNATNEKINQLAQVHIVHTVYGQEKISATISVDKKNRKLGILPDDIANFKPGLYKLSLTLRTVEGEVHLDQDFTWGVIAVNTNKSIYQSGEMAKIGIGVLDDKGNTMCKTGLFDHVDGLSMTVTDPQGKETDLSLQDNTIKDSGKCGPNTVTNEADFQTNYNTTTAGIYQMKVTATVYSRQRQIIDYFKVEPNVKFDVERTSFPTRIYPESPYPVTFTVTSSQDYQGTVEDTVPAFFGIEHIDNNGQIQKDGDFTKIVWNTSLTAGQAKTFTYFIKFPMVSPEFYLVGPLRLRSGQSTVFEEVRQWQIASDAVNSDSGLFTAEDNTGSHTWYRTWTGTTWNPALGTAPNSMSAVPQDSRWFKEVSSPITGEKLVSIEDNTGTDIYVFRWDGAAWNLDITMSTTIVGANSQYMDIGYNQLSGNAMLVYCDSGQTQIHYDRRINGTWDHAGSFASTVPSTIGTSTTQKTWVRLIPQANSDNMLIGYLDTGNRVGGFIWDGDNSSIISGSEIVDNAGTTASGHAHEAFTMAWENSDQVPMIIWSNAASAIIYRRFVSGSWSAESTTGLTGYAANVDWVNAASDDTSSSNDIAIGTQNTGAAGTVGCDFAVWDGSSWTKGTTTTCTTDSFTRNINVAWEHATGKAVWVYVASANNKVLTYRTWQSGSFSSSSTITGTETNQIKTVELYTDPNTVSIMCIVTTVDPAASANDEAFGTEWDGSSWTALPTVDTSALFAAVGASADNQPEEAFGFGFDLNLEKQVAYRWFADLPGTDTSVTTALAAQDTATTLTSANQKFRLRMLLYYPDTLASGGRSYILQYVDPDTGTCSSPSGSGNPPNWKDVPNVNDASTTLAYYDNTSVASASAITANAGLDPTYSGSTKVNETYNEQNLFTTNAAVSGTNVGLFDFSLVDKTTFGRSASTFCFRVKRSTGVILKIGNYPQITTASQNDVQINGGSTINGGTTIQ